MKCIDCLYCHKLPESILGISYGSPSLEDIKEFTYTHECRLNRWWFKADNASCPQFIEKDEREQLEELKEVLDKEG